MSVAWVGAGIAAVGVGAQIIGSNHAANAQAGAAAASNAELAREYDLMRADQAPYRNAGYSALARMSDLLGLSGNTKAPGYGSLTQRFTGANLASDPGYQFGLKQGLTTAQNSAAAKGGLYSGATLKALTQYGNDYATTKFDDAWNRYNTDQTNLYNRLAGVSGTGQTSTNMVDQAGQQYAQSVGNNLVGAGNARGANDIAVGNAIGNGLNQGGAWWLRSRPGGYQAPSEFQDGTTLYGGSGTTLYGDGYGPQ